MSLTKLDRFTKQQTRLLQDQVNAKMLEQSNRIQLVSETFKEALKFSNKTYFLEEMTKSNSEKNILKKELKVVKEKERLTD